MNWLKRKFLHLVPLLALTAVVGDAESAVLIDDFTTAQSVFNGSTGPVNVTGTQLGNLTRIITAAASPNDAETEVNIGNGFLNISNDSDSAGTASVFYSFDAVNLASVADGLLFNISLIDLSSEIQLIANGTSVFDFANLGFQGLYEIEFAQFSNPAAFNNLTSLRLNFRGAQSWDGQFGSLTADSKNVPEPSTLFLLTFGLAALARARYCKVVKTPKAG
ncbi:MAG: PEP-CTERM sorting domain-containing protein [Methylomonas sp.]|uniref:PEP-CTERM sorting domain-containing protein n=1 Tax=Methylomonas sp. TaxID=418 RepID=UPI0025EA1BF8|nr:PEP-CTERM sorting domain-containing protein [Methylomonas sp.]MCK9608363.1 PEP-CTERM sorting domain-containing protein [Methylomonas sp.]